MILADPFSYYLPTSNKLQYIFKSANLHPIGIPQEPIVELVAFDRYWNWLGFGCRFLTVYWRCHFIDHHRLKII